MAFDVRVEPFLFSLENSRKKIGFFKYQREKLRLLRTIDMIRRALGKTQNTPPPWARTEGDCVCHIKVAKLGVLQELKDYAARLDNVHIHAIKTGGAPTRFPHLIEINEQQGFIVPEDFSYPILAKLRKMSGQFPVLSSYRLQSELAEINKVLNVEKTFRIEKMPRFMETKDDDIAHFEASFNVGGDFWCKFGFLILTKVVEQSIEHKLPAIFR